MSSDIVIGIDIGTSGVRAVAMQADGIIVREAAATLPSSLRQSGRVTQQPHAWWSGLDTTLNTLLAALGRQRVRAIAVDGTSGTVLAVDGDGTPLGPARMYDDSAAAGEVARIAAVAPANSAAHGATSALARALQLAETPGIVRILHQADWVAGRLAGRFDISDENNALKTGYDPARRRWPDWISSLGRVADLLPTVVPAGTRIGTLTAALATRLGLPADVAIISGTTDGCASFLATGASRPGEAATALGSTLVIKQLSDQPLFAPEYGLYSHRISDLWLAGGASNSGGAVLLDHFSQDQLAALSNQLNPDQPTGLDYYPLRKPGERFPIADPTLAPRLAPRPDDPARFLQGLLEGIAAIEKLGYDRLATLGAPPLASVRTTGGGAFNQAWTRIRARVLGVPILPAASGDAAAGAARLAWRGLGVSL